MIHQQGKNVFIIALLYAGLLLSINHQLSRDINLLSISVSNSALKHREALKRLGLREQSSKEQQHQTIVLQRFGEWRANEELLEFVAGFDGGVIKLEREGNSVYFIREFMATDIEEIHNTKAAINTLVYWQFQRFSLKGHDRHKRGEWSLSLRQSAKGNKG